MTENNKQYELSQKQRAMERSIRATKRRLAAYDGALADADDEVLKRKLQNQFESHSAILKTKEKRLSEFCDKNGLYPEKDRVRVVGFNKSVSQKAVWANKTYLDKKQNSGIIAVEACSKKLKLSKQEEHILGTKRWLSESKRLISEGKSPKSFLFKDIDAQMLVDTYSGKGTVFYKTNAKYPIEYVDCPDVIGKTYDKKSGKYIPTKRIAIVYSKKGTHIYPVLEN